MESRQLNRNTTVTPFCIRGVKKKSCKCIHRKPGPFLLSQVAVGYICCQRVGKYLITPWTSIFSPFEMKGSAVMPLTRTLFVVWSLLSMVSLTCGEDATDEKSLAGRIVHTDPSTYRKATAVHGGAGALHYQRLLSRPALNTNFLFLHRGVIPPGGGIGHHFHHKISSGSRVDPWESSSGSNTAQPSDN